MHNSGKEGPGVYKTRMVKIKDKIDFDMELKRTRFRKDLHFLVMTALLLTTGFYLVSVWLQPENSLYNLGPMILSLIGYCIMEEIR